MRILHIAVNNKIATYTARDGHIVCGNSDYSLKFIFDSEWSAHATKTARFIWRDMYFDVIFTGDECSVPVINDTDEVTVGVYAGDLATTTPAVIPCERSILCGTNTAHEEAIKSYIDEALASVAPAIAAAAEAKASATEAKSSASEAKSSATVAKNAANQATAAANELNALLDVYINEIDTLVGG